MDLPNRQPSKEAVRQWLRLELELRRPPPDPAQIRRALGWGLVQSQLERGDACPR